MNRFKVSESSDGYCVVDLLFKRKPLTGLQYCSPDEGVIVSGLGLPSANKLCESLNILNIHLTDMEVECIHKDYHIEELTGFDRVDYLVYLIMKYTKETDNPEVHKILKRLLNDLDTPIEQVIEYTERFDNPDDYKYKYLELKAKYNRLEWLISKQITACEEGIQEVIDGDKDSYIVKHDIAIGLLKQLYNEVKWK